MSRPRAACTALKNRPSCAEAAITGSFCYCTLLDHATVRDKVQLSISQHTLFQTGLLSTAASDLYYRIHSANKVARTHERVSLTDEKETSMCDICQVAPLVYYTHMLTGKAVCTEEFASPL